VASATFLGILSAHSALASPPPPPRCIPAQTHAYCGCLAEQVKHRAMLQTESLVAKKCTGNSCSSVAPLAHNSFNLHYARTAHSVSRPEDAHPQVCSSYCNMSLDSGNVLRRRVSELNLCL
jgi:hypothetical protein